MSVTPRGIVRAICTLLIFASCALGRYKLDVLFIWCAYLVTDGLGERIAKANWTKQIGENPLEHKEDRHN